MADSPISNAKPRRFEDGGVARIDDGGGTEFVVKNIVPGSMNVRPGGRARITDVDRGDLRAAIREGDEQPTEITFRVKMTGEVGANDLITLSHAESPTTGIVPDFTFDADVPDARGATTGTKAQFANCVFAAPLPWSAGAEYDELEVTLLSTDHLGTWSTY